MNAHAHLVQLLKLARALNGVLVLPNEVGACGRWRFGGYYDERALLGKLDGDNSSWVIQQDRFKAWVSSLVHPPALQSVSVDWTYPKNHPSFFAGEQSCSGAHCFLCLRVTLLQRSSSNEIIF